MAVAIATLEARLAKGGGTADDWELLAKSYEFVGRPADAAKARTRQLPASTTGAPAMTATAGTATAPVTSPALTPQSLTRLTEASTARREKRYAAAAAIYRELAARDQLDADGWADYADTVATVRGNRLAGEPEAYIAHALALDPRHPKALWLQASAAEEAARWGDAVQAWQRLAAELEPGSADARIIAANLQRDTQMAAVAPAPAPAVSTAAGSGGAVLRGEVTVSDALRTRVSDRATLFIVAKAVDSPGVPVAVLRTTAASWPVTFTLDDSRAMLPERTLSSVARVTVEARISASGQATPLSGDLQGISQAIDPSAHQSVRILIDRVVP